MHAQLHFGSDGLQISNSFTQSYAASPQLYIRAPWRALNPVFLARCPAGAGPQVGCL